ncbi:NADPH nitroreductase [Peptostreptococcus russellii]|uniref:NADPH nitroreductase n=1 Tax=Peptostreptococcus russellii TaxID=215200 RepID=A0A2P7Q310_9FIRM|nr:nitroreductase family protein [Peptostreptococcus russellii]PSJ32346.1 NADPH nitroreductase [Peptostreptococcus russellii]
MKNETIERALSHRSIRAYKEKEIEADLVKSLLEVANHTSTSMGMQSYSIIRITDKKKREMIAKVCNQKYVNQAPEFWVFIVDVYRNAAIASEQGSFLDSRNDMDRFFQGFTDASLAAQNVLSAAESAGLGGVFFGSILNDPAKMIEILNLPEYTFPVVGLGMGYPDQDPLLKPRMDIELKVFENEYKKQDSYLDAIKDYDERMKKYYDLRNPSKNLDEFSKQVVSILSNATEKRSKIINDVRRQGFDLQLDYIPEADIKTMYKPAPKDIKEEVFEESELGFRMDTNIKDLFDEYPYIKSYILSVNPKFNKLRSLSASNKLKDLTIEDVAKIGEMPADSLIYMIESRISEE